MARFAPLVLKANRRIFSALTAGEGPVVLCLHGFPDNYYSFEHQLPVLAQAGYQAVAPLLRGYEPSSQSRSSDYYVSKMAEDVLGWVDDLGVNKVHLVGHDWGAVISYAACALAPEYFHSLSTLAIPHLRRAFLGIRHVPIQLLKSAYMLFFQLRGLSDYLMEQRDWAFLEILWKLWSPHWDYSPEHLARVKHTFQQPGVTKAALGYYRALFNIFSQEGRETLGLITAKIQIPTLAMTGVEDGCMDNRLFDIMMHAEDFPCGLQVTHIQNAGHFLHQENPAAVNMHLLHWLENHAKALKVIKQV